MTRLLPFLLVLLATPAWALDCKTATTQTDMNACAGMGFEAADAELNRIYGQLVARTGKDSQARTLLTKAQRDWLAFRDAECAFQASGVEGGSAQPMVVLGCREGLTRKRTADLKGYLTCQEGDLSCPTWSGR